MSYVEQVLSEVADRQEAQELVEALFRQFATPSAKQNLRAEANASKQTVGEVQHRMVSNLFRRGRSFKNLV